MSMSDEQTADLMKRFNQAFLEHDPSILDDLIAEDCVLENSGPAPDGSRHVGRAECLAWWTAIAANKETQFEPEEIWASGERAVLRWRLRWGPTDADSVRGVNLMRARDGQIIEGMGYVKG